MSNQFFHIAQYALVAAFTASFFASPVLAQDGTPTDDEVNKIAKQLYCPVCESTPLDVCPTEACRQWRELIREMLSDGRSEAEIKQYFVEHYGPQVLNEPPNRLLTYAVPIAAFLLGAFMLFHGFQMWKKPIAKESTTGMKAPGENRKIDRSNGKPTQDPYLAMMEEELRKRD
jgi:cytochrome c-type biogenesis protein CcmH